MISAVGKNSKARLRSDSILTFMLALGVMCLLYIIYDYAPFGNNSLACMDANIQYLDFFAYLQDVLIGKNSLTQTFSSFLGGNNIGTFSYYLASPFNLLVVFFDKADLHAFFDMLAALKMAMAAAAFCVFLHSRFREHLELGMRARIFCILLSLGYGLNQYTLAQSSNIMWLDGVYMLPLILTGVYYIVREKSGWRLSLFVGMSILFNWYTGGMNCLFSGFWICFEVVLYLCGGKCYTKDGDSVRAMMRQCCGYFVRYLVSMVVGVLLSMILFWPTVLAMQNSNKGDLAFEALKDFSFIGAVPSVIQGYALGAKSSYGSVSLFCGSLALIGLVLCFLSKGISFKTKAAFGTMLGGVLLLFYWKPLYTMFSLFKSVGSYWYRYSYVGILCILFLAAYFWIKENPEAHRRSIWLAGISWAGILILLDYLKPSQNRELTYYTAIFAVLTAVLAAGRSARARTGQHGNAVYAALSMLAIFELAYGSKLQMNNYHVSDVQTYREYVLRQERHIQDIGLERGRGICRISQTSTRNHNKAINQTANYNEAMAFGYASVSGYISTPDDVQLDFLHRLGYRKEGGCMTIVNTCLLGADSLLGVKYIMSEYPVNGLLESEGIISNDNKKVYENPFCLPLAFIYGEKGLDGMGSQTSSDNQNPFEYQNMLYSRLMGENVELYSPLAYSEGEEGDTVVYSIQIPAGNWAVYGNIPWERDMNAVIDVNHIYKMAYSKWLSPSVFYIPTENNGGVEYAAVELSTADRDGLKEGTEQFYALNLDVLGEVSDMLQTREVETMSVENGKANFEVETDEEASLFVSIPYDRGWTVRNNGEEITSSLFAGCMYSIPLQKGRNYIEMAYHLPGEGIGLIGTGIGGLLILGMLLLEKRGGWKGQNGIRCLCSKASNCIGQ